jgi:uncharacterized protein (TIGR00251 family)
VLEIKEQSGVITFAVRVQPRASRDAIEGEWQGALKVRVTAPPVDDRANEGVRRLLADALDVPASAVAIIGGQKSRNKRVRITGVTPEQVRNLLATDEHR